MFPLVLVLSKIKLFLPLKSFFCPSIVWGAVLCMGWIMPLWWQTVTTPTLLQYQQDLPRCLILLVNPTGEEAQHLLSLYYTHILVCATRKQMKVENGKWKIACRDVTLHTCFSSLLTLSLSLCAGWAGYYTWCCSTTCVCGGWKRSDCWGNCLVLGENVLFYTKGSGIPRIRSGTNSSGKNNAISFN